jgi:hypothetical protein
MPGVHELSQANLPPDLRDLANLQHIKITDQWFDANIKSVIQRVRAIATGTVTINELNSTAVAAAKPRTEKEEFLSMFGADAVKGVYTVIFTDAQLPEICEHKRHELGPLIPDGAREILIPHPPTKEALGTFPKGIRHVVAFEELEPVLRLDRLFRRHRGELRICLDRYYSIGEELPPNGGIAIGLGYNNATYKLGKLSGQLYEVIYCGQTDDFVIFDGKAKIEPRSLITSNEEYALLARILLRRGGSPPVPYFVCAGHTGDGTVAAFKFLAENWLELTRAYENQDKSLTRHHMAALLTHNRDTRDGLPGLRRTWFSEMSTN